MRLPPRGVVRFLCWHVLKLEFWHFAHPELNFGFVFASVFAGFSSKKCASRWAALYKNMLSSPFRIVCFGVFLCVCVCVRACVAFRICFFFGVLADSRLFAHGTCQLRLAFVFQLCAGHAKASSFEAFQTKTSPKFPTSELTKRCDALKILEFF